MSFRFRREVVASSLRNVRGSILAHADPRRIRQWDLTLSCGHVVERPARYQRQVGPRANGWHPRPVGDVLPAPRHAWCEECSSAARRCRECGSEDVLLYRGDDDEPDVISCVSCGADTAITR